MLRFNGVITQNVQMLLETAAIAVFIECYVCFWSLLIRLLLCAMPLMHCTLTTRIALRTLLVLPGMLLVWSFDM